MIVVANISEQEHWGRELRRLGIADTVAQRRNMTAPVLARRLRQVLASPTMAARAAEIAGAMSTEHGVDAAVALVMQTFAHPNVDALPAAVD